MDLTTANKNLPEPLSCPNMIAIASGKGGVGKTWFSTTLCYTLAQKGQRVLLFDGDLGLANVDIQLGLTPEQDLGGVLDNKITLKGAITHYIEGKFDIIAGRSGSGTLANIPTQRLAELRNDLIQLAGSYDKVIVDLGAGVDRPVRLMAGPAGMTLIVITDEPTSLTDAYAFIKLTHASNALANIGIVVNMAANVREGEKTYETILNVCRNFLKYEPPLIGIIRRDIKVREAIRAQTPLLKRHPSTEAAMDVEAIVRKLLRKG
ncbi:MAG: cobyrinic acid a,c-diamide synthase [Alphaproteobacteria bacterium]|nr:cobyrinic acid a,c-diamide synthase [Alphaproteobacteria bacterium]